MQTAFHSPRNKPKSLLRHEVKSGLQSWSISGLRSPKPTDHPQSHSEMPRGRQWTSAESANLAEAWSFPYNDPTRGIDQSSATFWDAMIHRYASFNFNHADSHGRHAERRTSHSSEGTWSPVAIKPQIALMLKDVQALSRALRRVVLSHPTGAFSETEIRATAVAIHTNRCFPA